MRYRILFAWLFLHISLLQAQPEIDLFRLYHAGDLGSEVLMDVYSCADGRYLVCGYSGSPDGRRAWVMKLDEEGEVIWSLFHGGSLFVSVIEADNGDVLVGGRLDERFTVIRLTSEGEVIWRMAYSPGQCHAIIELKVGDFILAGREASVGQIIRIDGEGNPIWLRNYRVGDAAEFHYLATMRETEGGIVLAGVHNPDRRPGRGWILKVNFDGDQIWSRVYEGESTKRFASMVSQADGFAIAGTYSRNWGGGDSGAKVCLTTVDSDGQLLLDVAYQLVQGRYDQGFGIAKLPDGGFCLVGYGFLGNPRRDYPLALRTNSRGDLLWAKDLAQDVERRRIGIGLLNNTLMSVIVVNENQIVACGSFQHEADDRGEDGLLLRLEPDPLGPMIFYRLPEDSLLTVLPGDSIQFIIRARTREGLELAYQWALGDSIIGADTTVTVEFDSLGNFPVTCRVSDEDAAFVVGWMVQVRDFFIRAHEPDTLNLSLRRGRSVDFSISVAAVEGDPISYQWTLANLDNPQPEVISDDSLATIEFLRSGNYALEAFASRGESFDVVNWTISVRGAVWSFWPDELSLTVPPDTLINFGVNPFNPESDSLSYAWYFGEDLLGMDSAVDVQFGGEGRVEVTAIVTDGAEVDTILWSILVQPLDAVESNFLFPLSSFALSASPNPFNANTTVSYGLPAAAEIWLTLHDIGGRRVRVLADGLRLAGRHSALLDGSGLPAGVYLIRLEAGSNVRMMKAVLVK